MCLLTAIGGSLTNYLPLSYKVRTGCVYSAPPGGEFASITLGFLLRFDSRSDKCRPAAHTAPAAARCDDMNTEHGSLVHNANQRRQTAKRIHKYRFGFAFCIITTQTLVLI